MNKPIMINSDTARLIQNHNGLIVPNSVYVSLGGGLGDVFYVYNKGENGWGYIKSLKETFPHVHVKALCSTHNPQTVEFIKYNPYIDEYHEFGWVNNAKPLFEKNSNGSRRLDRQGKLLKALKFNNPKIYTTKEDDKAIDRITSAGSFVLIHPFAGEPGRRCLPTKEYIPIIDSIIDDKKLNVVIIGGTYKRKNFKTSEDKKEELDYSRDGLFNLVGKSNARVCATLAAKQKHFIGSWSAYSCASWSNKKNTTVIVNKSNVDALNKRFRKGHRWHNVRCNVVVTNGPANNPRETDFDDIREQILDSIHVNRT